MKSVSLFLYFLFCLGTVKSQSLNGVWVSSHELRVGTYLDLDGLEKQMARMMQEIFLEDSVYSEGGWIMDIDSTGAAALLRDIRSEFIQNAYQPEDEQLAFGNDTLRIEKVGDTSLNLIRQMTDSIWFEKHFHRLPDSDLAKNATTLPNPISGAHLQLSVSDTLNRNYQLDFIDKRQLVITGTKDNMPFTIRGTWHSRWVGNILLFSFFDNHFDQMQLYFFYKDSANTLIGGSFNNAAILGHEPKQLQTRLAKVELPGDVETIRNGVVGSWEAVNDPLFYDPAIEFGFLSYQSFEITFESDGNFSLLKSGTVLKNGDSIPLEESSVGKWEVSPTGNYLILKPQDEIPFYFSIEKAGSEELDVYYFMKTLSEFPNYNVFENRRVELRRL